MMYYLITNFKNKSIIAMYNLFFAIKKTVSLHATRRSLKNLKKRLQNIIGIDEIRFFTV
jgi:hypothetical protein